MDLLIYNKIQMKLLVGLKCQLIGMLDLCDVLVAEIGIVHELVGQPCMKEFIAARPHLTYLLPH